MKRIFSQIARWIALVGPGLFCLGFTIGTRISTVSDLKGNKILSVRGSRIAIDSTMASKILFCPE